MRLRYQLLLVSLLVLCLPWAGFQYVREIEQVMLEMQQREVLASARALALRLAEEPDLFAGADEQYSDKSIYFRGLAEPPELDGFDDDWRAWNISEVPLVGRAADAAKNKALGSTGNAAETKAWLRSGAYYQNFYLFLRIHDVSPVFLDPTIHPLHSGDYLKITPSSGAEIFVSTAAPGELHGRYLDQQNRVRSEYAVVGTWVDTAEGYNLELRIRADILDGGVALEYGDLVPGSDHARHRLELGFESGRPARFVQTSSRLQQDILVFAGEDLRLGLSNRSGWLMASAGNFAESGDNRQIEGSPRSYPLVSMFNRWLLNSADFPELDDWRSRGRFESLDVLSALVGQTRSTWFNAGDQHIARAVVPVQRGGEVLGAVVAEKTGQSVSEVSSGVFGRLIIWTLLAAAIASMGLFLYAGILSFRIRRLNDAAKGALTENLSAGVTQTQLSAKDFPVSRMSDELGDLSRGYAELLSRLAEYTDYLKTLSSKLSHELRTPLAIVRTSLDNLEHEQISEEARVYADRAAEGGVRLSAILNAMSSASRLEESIKQAESESLDLGCLIPPLVASYRDAYPQANIEAVYDANLKFPIQAAPELIVQMLDKLIDNAVDFCPAEGRILLELNLVNGLIRLKVSNDGPLLPDKMKNQLFDSLVSLRDGHSDKPNLGLGLYIVRLIVEFHQARVAARNRDDGTGVEFIIQFPAQV